MKTTSLCILMTLTLSGAPLCKAQRPSEAPPHSQEAQGQPHNQPHATAARFLKKIWIVLLAGSCYPIEKSPTLGGRMGLYPFRNARPGILCVTSQ
jgi:hypothetical protein